MNTLDIFQNFIQKEQQRTKIPIGGQTQAILDYCQFVIHSQYDKKSKTKYRFKERKNQICEDFMRAFETLEREDKIRYYIKNVNYLIRIHNKNFKAPNVRNDVLEAFIYTKSHGLGVWKKKKMRLDNPRQIIYAEKNDTIKEYDLGDYIFRGSKNTKFSTFVLEAIKQSVHYKSKTVHFGFDSVDEMQLWAQAVQLCIDFRHWQKIYIEIYHQPLPKQSLAGSKVKESSQLPKQPMTGQNFTKNTPPQTIKNENITVESLMGNQQATKKVNFNELQMKQSPKQNLKTKKKRAQTESQSFTSDSGDDDKKFQPGIERTIIEDLVEGEMSDGNMQIIESRNLKERENKNMKHLNIFHRMFPDYEFNEVQWQGNFEMIYNERNLRIMQSIAQKYKYKMIMQFQNEKSTPCQYILKAICGPDFQLSYNDNVQEISIKTMISSQNSAIMYMALKPFSRIYRGRDFVFIRHAFSVGQNAYYIADKDIQNTNFPPFLTIVRGKYECVWAILRKQGNRVKLVGDIYMDNSGYLNQNQNSNLVLNYLKGYKHLSDFVENNKERLKKYLLFDFNWDITKNKQNQKEDELRIKRKSDQLRMKQLQKPNKNDFVVQSPLNKNRKGSGESSVVQSSFSDKKSNKPQPKLVIIAENQKFPQKQPQRIHIPPLDKSFDRHSRMQDVELERQKMSLGQVEGQISPQQLKTAKFQTNNAIKLNFDSQGMVIIPKSYMKAKYQLTPTKTYPQIYWTPPGTHPLPENEWKHDTKVGGFLFTNQKKIDDQKGVLKFILSKVGKNLLSGKSILSISLPVDIFVAKSNLELFIDSLCYAPVMLEKVANADPMEKYKAVTAFGITMSILYLQMEKPFNPILGETFQAWVHGCPAYAQQISHHPPISALLLYGRGYTISGQLQSKAELHMNSGTGTNEGIFRVNFDDGTKVCFCSAGGEVSGVTYGDRKFNVIGKAYSWTETLGLFSQIVYNPSKKGFFSMKKQEQPQDYFEGQVYKVTDDFIYSLNTKRRVPTEKEITGTFGKYSGIWHQKVFYDDELLLQIIKTPPYKLQYEKNPLPSDSNWREDIAYRRLMQVPRAQAQKQRLQVLQRADKKLRANHAK